MDQLLAIRSAWLLAAVAYVLIGATAIEWLDWPAGGRVHRVAQESVVAGFVLVAIWPLVVIVLAVAGAVRQARRRRGGATRVSQ